MQHIATPPNQRRPALSDQIRAAVFWRSGSQVVSQVITWTATLAVIRLLAPRDYGLFAMTQTVLSLLAFLNGSGFASALVQAPELTRHRIRQVFGILLLLNGGLALVQLTAAPLVAAYYRQPELTPLIRVQCLVFLCVPFTALPDALLSRGLDFRNQAIGNLAAALVCAVVSLAGALLGWGVWTLVVAPISGFWTRAALLTILSRTFVLPSFDLRGAGSVIGFGSALLLTQFLWVMQSQSDVFIGGRLLDPHALGLYTEGLFLTQIVVAKFVPPLNEVAFPAYARIRQEGGALADAFAGAVRLVFLATAPIFLGLAAAAEPIVATLFGPKWHAMTQFVQLTALAMPFVTLQVLFPPAVNALGRTDRTLRVAMTGAIVFPSCFLVGAQFGAIGLAAGWLAAAPLLAVATATICAPVIGIAPRALAAAVLPGLGSAAVMALAVRLLDGVLPVLDAPVRLAALVAAGGVIYLAVLRLAAPAALAGAIATLRRR
jgi:O-antigen/teichoic acid export membrane protein